MNDRLFASVTGGAGPDCPRLAIDLGNRGYLAPMTVRHAAPLLDPHPPL